MNLPPSVRRRPQVPLIALKPGADVVELGEPGNGEVRGQESGAVPCFWRQELYGPN
jgi:hypothetical protein